MSGDLTPLKISRDSLGRDWAHGMPVDGHEALASAFARGEGALTIAVGKALVRGLSANFARCHGAEWAWTTLGRRRGTDVSMNSRGV